MASENLFGKKIKELYVTLCKTEWNATISGVIIGLLSVLLMAWWRPWGAVGAVRNWGDWILYTVGVYSNTNTKELLGFINDDGVKMLSKSFWYNTGSVIGIGFVGGAFLSACLGGQFALRFPPLREYIKAFFAGTLMGVGATMAGGCNVGGMYNSIGNLSASGFAMWLGLVLGALGGLWLLYKEMEYISWGSGGAKTFEFPPVVQFALGIVAIAALIWGANAYANFEGGNSEDYINSLPGVLLIAAGLGYTMQRGRWCMIQGFREPHMTGNCTMAKSVALSICIVAAGAAVLKYAIPVRAGGDPVLNTMYYVRGTFGWGGVVGGFLFGVGAILAGGCGTGTLWRVGEGQIKLWFVALMFGLSSSLSATLVRSHHWEVDGFLGKYVYLPDVMGYGPSLLLIFFAMALWYVIVTWNEETGKLILPM